MGWVELVYGDRKTEKPKPDPRPDALPEIPGYPRNIPAVAEAERVVRSKP